MKSSICSSYDSSHSFVSSSHKTAFQSAFLAAVVLLLVTGAAWSQVTVSPAAISFGNHYIGQITTVFPVILTNNQAVALQITSIAVTGGPAPGDFPLGIVCPLQHPLAAGQSCTINVRYRPSVQGSNTASLTINFDATDSPQNIALSGAGLLAVSAVPDSVAFPALNVGTTSSAASITLTNNQSSKLTFSSVAASGDFAIASNTCGASLAGNAQCTIGVIFTPTAAGAQSGTITVADNAPGSPTVIALSGTGNAPANWSNIKHVIIIFQENRSTDTLFQDPVLIARGADIAGSGINSAGQVVPLTSIDLGTAGTNPQNYDLNHSRNAFLLMYDGGKMDGADKIPVTCNSNAPATCPPPNAQFRYVSPADVGPYFQLGEQYTFGDRMFQTNEGPSFPAHQFILSGTSAPTETSTGMVTGNIANLSTTAAGVGCLANAGAYTQVLDVTGKATYIFPCFEHATLSDLLEAAGISWKYYAQFDGSLWTAPNAIEHICGPNVPPPNATACAGTDWTAHVMISNDKAPTILQDIANGNLAGLSWVTPTSGASDHAGSNNGTGPSWVASIVNAVGNSQYWSDTAIVLTWDDWGGWYDHVAPQVIDDGVSWGSGSIYGFRVPLIVISPYAKPGYISHVNHDFGSIVHFAEQVFDLPSLGFADARADDLSDCFDFAQAPLPFNTIESPLKANYFVNNPTPRMDPDDD